MVDSSKLIPVPTCPDLSRTAPVPTCPLLCRGDRLGDNPSGMARRCDRCGEGNDCETFGGIPLCEECIVLVVKEWRIKRDEFGALTHA